MISCLTNNVILLTRQLNWSTGVGIRKWLPKKIRLLGNMKYSHSQQLLVPLRTRFRRLSSTRAGSSPVPAMTAGSSVLKSWRSCRGDGPSAGLLRSIAFMVIRAGNVVSRPITTPSYHLPSNSHDQRRRLKALQREHVSGLSVQPRNSSAGLRPKSDLGLSDSELKCC